MKVLLSIKPVFASQIESGNKKYEYRRVIFNNDVKTVVVYVTTPVKKVIGEFEIDSILFDNIENLWKKTKDHSGISKNTNDILGEKNIYSFLESLLEMEAREVLSEIFYQMKKDMTGSFLKYDASVIYIEVDNNAIIQV